MGELGSSLPDELNFLLHNRAPGKRQIKPVSAEQAKASLTWVRDICGDDDDDDAEIPMNIEDANAESDAVSVEEAEDEEGEGDEEDENDDSLGNQDDELDEDELAELSDSNLEGGMICNDVPIFNTEDAKIEANGKEGATTSTLPAGLGFLLKSRAPGKRKVKPVSADRAAYLVECGGSDDDDQDFEIGDKKVEDSNDDENDSEDDSDASFKIDDAPYSPVGSDVEIVKEERGLPIHIDLDADSSITVSTKAEQEAVAKMGPKLSDTLVCLLCLKDNNEDKDNELVQCDGCGIACHILCYGIGECSDDGGSGRSTPLSSASTEPWFCDSCRAGNSRPSCQLCPNEGGAFKICDSGHWVHLVCALYTGCSFGEVGGLSKVNVNAIKQKRWGSRVCILCQDPQYASTGVCISCDAGMCRLFFHVTCAQREGLLAEAPVAVAASVLTSSMQAPLANLSRMYKDDYSSSEESRRKQTSQEVADPFYACCKRHSNPEATKRNKRNFLAAVRICNTFKQEDRWDLALGRDRYERKLNCAVEKFTARTQKAVRSFIASSAVSLCYQSRPLTSCPMAIQRAINKAKLGGVDEDHLVMSPTSSSSAAAHYSPLSFSSRFFQYFEARNRRIEELMRQCRSFDSQQKESEREEIELKKTYEVLFQSVRRQRDQGDRCRKDITDIHSCISGLLNSHFKSDTAGNADFLVPALPAEIATTNDRKRFETELKETAGITIYECTVCKQTREQHMMMACGTCMRRFHCFCLDPPLSQPWTTPTKPGRRTSAKWSWECPYCCPSSSDNDVVRKHINVDAPRQLRREIKAPVRFIVSSEKDCSNNNDSNTNVNNSGNSKGDNTVPMVEAGTGNPVKSNGRNVCHTNRGGKSRKRSRGGGGGNSGSGVSVEKPEVLSSPAKKGKQVVSSSPATQSPFKLTAVAAPSGSKSVDIAIYDFSSDSN